MRLYFDFISPYAYLVWHAIHPLAERHGRTVEPVPIVLAVLLNAYGHLGPAEIPPKRVYAFKDVAWKAAALGLTVQPPPSHPFNPLLALRVVGLADGAQRDRLISALYDEVWAGGRGVERPEVVAEVAEACGVEDPIARATAPESKVRLKANTAEALRAGAFGVPTIVADGELFWGVDSLPHLDRFLTGENPVDPDLLQRWLDLPASASR